MSEDELRTLRAENERLRAQLGVERPSRAFLETAVQAVPVFMVEADADDRITYINRLQPGLRLEDVIGRSLVEFNDPSSTDVMIGAIERARATGTTSRYQSIGLGAHGKLAYYDCFVSPLAGGGICLVALDVTEHRQHEAALERSEEKLRVALDAIPIGLWSYEVASEAVVWDALMHELTGREQPLGPQAYAEVAVHPEDREMVRGAFDRTMRTGRYEGPVHRILRPDGSVRWVLSTGRAVRGEDGAVVRTLGAIVDITEQRTVEDRLRRAQKLEAVGRLTAGVAHNFNNMLAAILPTLEILRRGAEPDRLALIEDAHHAGTRAAEMVRQLMTFSGQRRGGSWIPCRPEALVAGALNICRRTFDRHIVLESDVPAGLPAIVGDVGTLEQVVVNLLLNARDAVEEASRPSPRIAVKLDAVCSSNADRGGALEPDEYVRIRVIDDGIGMDARVRERIFEPFFTTKEVDVGTGLGLATSYTIIRDHGGWIDCESAPGQGTTFSVFLPVAKGAREAMGEEPAPEPPLPAMRVLLVDDELAVRRVMARVLSALGHEVVAAEDGPSAIAALTADSDFAVVMLDRSMPGAPGDRFVPQIRALAPGARIAFFTGQSVSAAERALVDGVVLKPVTRAQLERDLRRLVDPGARDHDAPDEGAIAEAEDAG